MRALERLFETILWNSRFITLFAVVASLLGACAMFYIAGVDVWDSWHRISIYADPTLTDAVRSALRGRIIAVIAEFVDGFLFALVLLIFALGIYELFIGDIEVAAKSQVANRILIINSLDDLKDRLAKVIFLILIVRYFEYALETPVKTASDLVLLAVGILLIAVALYLTKPKDVESH